MREHFQRVLPIAVLLVLAAKVALGCGMCNNAVLDDSMPPHWLWPLLATSWYLSNGIVGLTTGMRYYWLSGVKKALVVSVLVWIFGAGLVGTFAPLFLLGLPALLAFGFSFRPSIATAAPRSGIVAIRVLGLIHILAFAVAMVVTPGIYENRTTEDFIIKWEGTASSRSHTLRLIREEPFALEKFRYLVRHGGSSALWNAAEHLAEVGDPEIDIPLLEEAVARLKREDGEWAVSMVEPHIETLRARRVRHVAPTAALDAGIPAPEKPAPSSESPPSEKDEP